MSCGACRSRDGTHTFGHVLVGKDEEVKVGSIAQSAAGDDFTFQFKDRDAGAIKLDSFGLFLGLELEEDGGGHGDDGLARRSGGGAPRSVPVGDEPVVMSQIRALVADGG